MKKEKISIALSGGIDSSASSIIIKKSGFFIEAVFMKNWEYEKTLKCNKKDIKYAKKLSNQIKIPVNINNFSKDYWENVFIPFIKNLKNGETPNPDITCNKKIKFKTLIKKLIYKHNFNYLATGHYSKIIKKKTFSLNLSFDKKKDQTYFIYTLNNKIIQKIIFPLSNYSKKQIKKYVKNKLLINYNKKESMGICFIEEKNIKFFLKDFIKNKTGNIIEEKNIIGTHNGAHLYTLGEKKKIKEQNLYIYKKDIKKNEIHVTKDPKKLEIQKIKINNNKTKINDKIICDIKTRHQYNLNKCLLIPSKKELIIIFKIPQTILNAGQHIVLYKLDRCIGGYKL